MQSKIVLGECLCMGVCCVLFRRFVVCGVWICVWTCGVMFGVWCVDLWCVDLCVGLVVCGVLCVWCVDLWICGVWWGFVRPIANFAHIFIAAV